MYHCRLCKKGYKKLNSLQKHHVREHKIVPQLKVPLQLEPMGIDYSFFNSPKQLVLELENYRIRIERK